ncbi:MFS transporter, ACS family, D-galactonate transporter [Pseudozobellia thermophila]|uniref:MFS transporter, ACS family, D-galactonate transporter n=2 Tax=Pseudozobellia thermophila TaxID=192903 RepID=A0A1M6GGI7_9FLAO|nr:MFS transporter, ACS family, D-galactonate transporter [Pseudozobellia thermophila]
MEDMPKMTKKRYSVLAMVFITVVINYLDRTNISIAASALQNDLGLDSVQLGYIFSAFAWTYAILQIPGGFVADRLNSRLLYALLLALWSIATLVQGMVNSFAALLGLRASIGVFEAPSYPINNLVVSRWFPESERASAIGIYTSGQFLGMAFLLPILAIIQSHLGWRGLFYVSGAVGLLWALVWYLRYRDPQNHKTVSKDELEMIKKGGGVFEDGTKSGMVPDFNLSDIKKVFSYRKLWGVYLGQFCLGATSIFFLTWFPTYLVKYRGLDFIQSGFLASLPYLAAFVGVLMSGFGSDLMVRKGFSPEVSRKAPVLLGLLLSTAIVGANYTDNTALVILFLSIAFFGNGLASIAWVFISLMAPKNLMGLTGGAFNFIGGLSAIVVPVIIGYLVKDGDFSPALFFVGVLALLGFLFYTFMVGKVKRLE